MDLNGDGDSATISFAHSDWDILGTLSTTTQSPLFGNIYDKDGKMISSQQLFRCEDLCKMEYDDGLTDFTMERYAYDKLKINVGENIRSEDFEVSIYVGNQYDFKTVSINISPSSRYEYERMEYSSDKMQQWNDFKETHSFTIDNQSNDTIVAQWRPYQDQYRTISFTSNDPAAFRLLGSEKVQVRLPKIEDGKLVLDGDCDLDYYPSQGKVSHTFPDVVKNIAIAPGEFLCTYILDYQCFETDFTMYARNPNTGKERAISGKFSSRLPVDYYHTMQKIL